MLRGADLTAIAAIARPDSFFRQLTELGAWCDRTASPIIMHSRSSEARYLRDQASSSDFVVCHSQRRGENMESIWPAEAGSLCMFTAFENRRRGSLTSTGCSTIFSRRSLKLTADPTLKIPIHGH